MKSQLKKELNQLVMMLENEKKEMYRIAYQSERKSSNVEEQDLEGKSRTQIEVEKRLSFEKPIEMLTHMAAEVFQEKMKLNKKYEPTLMSMR